MNKLAVVAFALLMFFSSMLWYLANNSLNEYLESQIKLQGHYYSGQKITLTQANLSDNSGVVIFKNIALANLESYQEKNVLIIDEVAGALATTQHNMLITEIKEITIDKLILNVEHKENMVNNIEEVIKRIRLKLANDYPEQYPQISAKLYAQQHPDLNAEVYVKENPQAGTIIEHKAKNKTRGQSQQKYKILNINIKNLEINTNSLDDKNILHKTTINKNNVHLASIGSDDGIVLNQLGGEILLSLLNLYQVSNE